LSPRGLNPRDAARRLRSVSTPMERAVDAVMRRVAPKAALIRAHRRLMERDADYRDNWLGAGGLMAARGYKAAGSPTNGTPWLGASNRSADSELILDLPIMRARSRQLERDDSLASGVVRTRLRQVVGSGLRPQASTVAGKALNDAMEEVFASRSGDLFPAEGRITFAQAQRIMYTRLLVDGECFVKRAKTAADEPVWFELVEADRVGTPLDARPKDAEGRIVDGVEKDRYGRVVAYWVAKDHPGEVVRVESVGKWQQPVAKSTAFYTRVPYGEIKHLRYRVMRPGQTRGVPLMHACMQDFHDLDLLTLALLKRTQVAACLSLFIKSEGEVAELFEVTAEDYGYQLEQQLEPGMMFKLFPGEEVQSVIPGMTVPDMEPIQKALAKRIGASCEMSPEAVLHDWGNTNYSSARTVQIEDNRSYDTDRVDLADQGLTWIWSETLADAALMGDARLSRARPEEFSRVRWVGDARPWVDPASQGQATEIMLSLGLTTLRDEAAALGKDWEELAEQRAIERDFLAQFGEEDAEGDDGEDMDEEPARALPLREAA